MTQQELAKAIWVTPQHISAIEQGKRDPSLFSLARLARELGVTIDYLVTNKDSVITDVIPAIKGDEKLSLKTKKALIPLVQELYALRPVVDHEIIIGGEDAEKLD